MSWLARDDDRIGFDPITDEFADRPDATAESILDKATSKRRRVVVVDPRSDSAPRPRKYQEGRGRKGVVQMCSETRLHGVQTDRHPRSPTSWRQCEVYISHIQALTTRDTISDRARDRLIATNGKVVGYLFARGRYNDAQTLGEPTVITVKSNYMGPTIPMYSPQCTVWLGLRVSGPLRRSREVLRPSVAQSGAAAWIRPRHRTHHNAQFGLSLQVSRPLRRSREVVQPSVAQSGATAWIRPRQRTHHNAQFGFVY